MGVYQKHRYRGLALLVSAYWQSVTLPKVLSANRNSQIFPTSTGSEA